MAEYLPIRAFNRSQNVRIESQKVTPTTTVYVDISKATTRKELSYHSAIGAVYVVGTLSSSNSVNIVSSGVTTNQGASSADLVVTTEPGTIRNRQTGTTTAVVLTESTLAAADATNPRIDIIEVKVADGSVKKVTGTAAASPVPAATDEGYIAVAQISVLANATGIANNKITDVRPLA